MAAALPGRSGLRKTAYSSKFGGLFIAPPWLLGGGIEGFELRYRVAAKRAGLVVLALLGDRSCWDWRFPHNHGPTLEMVRRCQLGGGEMIDSLH